MNIDYEIIKLDNGINIMYIQKPNTNVTSFQVFCKVGSIYENKKIQGTSHYLEHMVFKGTDKRPTAKDISSQLDSVGSYFNAYTDKNITGYIVKVSSNNFEIGVDIISDMLMNSKFKNDDFEKEKNIVVEEVNKGRDQPGNQIIENLYELVFEGHQLGHSIGGYEEIIRNYNLPDVKAYFDKFYIAQNITISVCTNLDKNTVVNYINKYFRNFVSNVDYIEPIYSKHVINTTPRYKILQKDLEQIHLALAFPTVSMNHSDRFVLDVIKIILAGNMSSRLFIAMREEAALSYTVSVNNGYYEDTGCCYIYTGFDKKSLYTRNTSELTNSMTPDQMSKVILPGGLPIILDNLHKLKNNLVSDKELKDAIGYLKGSLILETEDSLGLSDYFGKQLVFKKNNIENFNDILDNYSNVSSEDIQRVASQYFKKEHINVSVIGNCEEERLKTFIKSYLF